MSGTSLDGVDAVLVDLGGALHVLAHARLPFARALRDELQSLNEPGANELHRVALAANALARCYAQVVTQVLRECRLEPPDIIAIGAHGQTLRHRPGEFDGTGYTVQALNGALLAELSGIDVVADLRSRDLAAGGQGAPLVPAFHRARFAREGASTAVLNLGGIANLTLLRADGSTIGFDCGPANALMDHWCERHVGAAYDASGAWAASGTVDTELLAAMLADPYFAKSPPKSTGRDLFNPGWLASHLHARPGVAAQDVQSTLAELTVRSASAALLLHAPEADELLVCGGGALNGHLMARLAALVPGRAVQPTDARGLPAMQVEAAAFAWLAQAHCERRPGNLASVTGAAGGRVLGALYPR